MASDLVAGVYRFTCILYTWIHNRQSSKDKHCLDTKLSTMFTQEIPAYEGMHYLKKKAG